MPDIHCAITTQRSPMPPNRCAMISRGLGDRALFFIAPREAKRSTPMMAADRFTLTRRAALLLLVFIAIPAVAHSASLEESAKEFARKIAAAVPAGANISSETRNVSSLRPGEVQRIDQSLKAELQEKGVSLAATGAAVSLLVTLSENLKTLIWTAEIRQGAASQVILMAVNRLSANGTVSSKMPVTIQSEKFWEGPERVLDAGEISNGTGKSWLVLLLADRILIQDKQTGSTTTLEIASNQSASRDPWGNLQFGLIANSVTFFLAPRVCNVNLEAPTLEGCLPGDGSAGSPPAPMPMIFDIAPAGQPPPGKGTLVEMKSVCAGANQFLATGSRDYTQTDSLQLFQADSTGAIAASAELDFPGPIVAVHGVADPPRAVAKNLTTGKYEAYRLSFSCGQ